MIPLPGNPVDRAMRIGLFILLIAAAALIGIGGVWILKGRYDRGVVTKANAKQDAIVQGRTTVANEQMAVEVIRDVKVITTQKEELSRATIDRPDGLTARQRRGCIILRQQGQDLSRHATCRSLGR